MFIKRFPILPSDLKPLKALSHLFNILKGTD